MSLPNLIPNNVTICADASVNIACILIIINWHVTSSEIFVLLLDCELINLRNCIGTQKDSKHIIRPYCQ